MLDPDRLKDSHTPGGFLPPGKETNAIRAHEFGLKLNAPERAQLIAFLRTLCVSTNLIGKLGASRKTAEVTGSSLEEKTIRIDLPGLQW